jgi:hypothetical protein
MGNVTNRGTVCLRSMQKVSWQSNLERVAENLREKENLKPGRLSLAAWLTCVAYGNPEEGMNQ